MATNDADDDGDGKKASKRARQWNEMKSEKWKEMGKKRTKIYLLILHKNSI